MKCPIDPDTDLVMADRSGIEIDYCPKCRGVWLDRGELDKIIERAAQQDARDRQPPHAPQQVQPPYGQPQQPYGRKDDDSVDEPYDRYGRRKHKSFWRELFD